MPIIKGKKEKEDCEIFNYVIFGVKWLPLQHPWSIEEGSIIQLS